MKKRIVFVLIGFFIVMIFSLENTNAIENTHVRLRAIVIEEETILKKETNVQIIKAKILEGKFEGKAVEFSHRLVEGSEINIRLNKNMHIFVQITLNQERLVSVNFVDVVRDRHIFVLLFIFFVLLVIFGGIKGFRSFVALALTGICILKIFMPMVLEGYGFVSATIISSLVITIVTFIVIDGITRKSLSSILGTIGGTIIAGLLAIYFGNLMEIVGTAEESMQMLIMYTDLEIDYRGLLYSGITIGALGAVMDVSMTVSSVIFEIKRKKPSIKKSTLIVSGIAVGRDVMATMTNTLILAYAGASFPLMFLFFYMELPLLDIVNSQQIAAEIVRSLSGSIGIILTIPATAIIAAYNAK
ncbi:MAG: YibE/F family protein [Alkaliphilus sp.]